jgi:predicted RNA-binding protein (TIGR00451 family)
MFHAVKGESMNEIEIVGDFPGKKLVVSKEAVPFVSRGGRIFSKLVIDADKGIKEGEMVKVVDKKGRLLTVARALLTEEELGKMRNLSFSS